MKKLDTYIIKQLLTGFLLVTFSLMSILWLTQSLRFVELITNKGLPISIFIELTTLLMPRLFSLISPIALFVGTLFVYNKMLSDRELVVIKAAGIAPLRMALPAFFVGFVMSVIGVYTNIVAIPSAERAFGELEWKVKNDVSHLMFREGEFTNLKSELTVFVGAHEKDGSISNVLINDERKKGVKSTISAERGRVVYTDKGPRIILVNGVRQEVDENKDQFISISFDRYSVDIGSMGSNKVKTEKYREKSLRDLLGSLNDETISKKERNKFFVEGNRRILSPIFNLIFALIACTGLVVGNFNRRGQFSIITTSIVSMIVVQAGDLAYANMAVKKIHLLSLYYANLLIPFLVCLCMLLFYNPLRSVRKKNKEALADA